MPAISEHQSTTAAKILLIGNTGAGKTTALATLANAGFRLFILDYDNGLDTLRHFVKPEFHHNVFFKTFIDPVIDIQGRVAGIPSAAANSMRALDNWTELGADGKPASLGGVKSWGADDVLVIDSLTMLGNACMNFALAMNGRLGQRPTMGDWGDAIKMQENLIQLLYGDAVKCNVVVTAHLAFQEDMQAGGISKGFPSALGSKLPPKIGRYFNSVLLAESTPRPAGAPPNGPLPRVLRTQSTMQIELKSPLPDLATQIPINPKADKASGLAYYIRRVQGKLTDKDLPG